MPELPTQARVVIVGGGIIGCSTAYHLAKLGCSDVLLLERAKITSGSTHHAAGLVGQLRTSAGITQLLGHSVTLYESIEKETGLATGWKMNGGLRLACTPERMVELQRQIDDVVGAAFLPTDGQANPSDITQALAKGARLHGATLAQDCAVTGVEMRDGRVAAVVTTQGRVACEIVVNCCGQWAREFAKLAGVNVPLVSIQHQYMITEAIDGVSSNLPTLRDPDRLTYYKEEVGGLVMGGYEPNPLPWAEDGIPEGFHFSLLDSNWEHFEQFMNLALPRVPALQGAGVKQLINGPESFTPDGNFILGEAPEVSGYYVAAGFNAFGIAAGGGAGKALAEWILGGEPPYDLWPVDIRRFGRPHGETDWVRSRTHEMYARHYTIAWPHEENQSGRSYRRSPLYDELRAAGACFGEKLGWERPNWFAPSAVEPRDDYSFERQNWFAHVGREHRAVRERVGVFDQTSFAKFELAGKDAERALSWMCANNVARDPGSVIYTQLLNSRGGIECDLTVARLAEDRYYIVTGTGFASHDFHWIRTHVPADLAAKLTDVTDSYSVISVFGPKSRDLLSSICGDDLGNEAFAFGSAREISVAGVPVVALRMTYVGELGWELHTPVASARQVYGAVMAAGEVHGVANCGYRAIESLRLEKGYRAWSSDLSPDHTPLQAGLGFAVKLHSNTPFLGREALVEQRQQPLKRRLACFTSDDNSVVLLGRETIYRNGERVGWLTSGGFGYTVDSSIGYGYVRSESGVDREYLRSGTYELEVASRRVPASIHFAPLYDPGNQRIRA